MSKFKHPQNDYTESASTTISYVWCFLFGWLYFAVKGNARHAVLHFMISGTVWWWLVLPTFLGGALLESPGALLFAISMGWATNLIYACFVKSINEKSLLRKGWSRVESPKPS